MSIKKVVKVIGIIFLSLSILVCATIYFGSRYYKEAFFTAGPNYLSIEKNNGSFHFQWMESVFDGHLEPHGGIGFPVKIKGLDGVYIMQWDSGSPSTIFYKNALFSLFPDGKLPDTLHSNASAYLKDFQFSVGDSIEVSMQYARLIDYGEAIDLEDSTKLPIIGTIGMDFIDQNIFSMNFASQEVVLSNQRSNYDHLDFQPIQYVGRRLLFPAAINNQDGLFFYDSGTSPFGVITTKAKFKKYGDANAKDIAYHVNSWGTQVLCHNKKSTTPILLANKKLALNRVSYMQWKDGLQSFFMAFSDIKGLLGNKALLDKTIIIDTKNKEFAIEHTTSQ